MKAVQVVNAGLPALVDAGSFVCPDGGSQCLAPSIEGVVLEGVYLDPPPGKESSWWTGEAGKTLQHVKHLELRSCRILDAGELL
jgi:hypothetical protein